MFSGFNMMFPDHMRPFNASYKCYSVSMFPGTDRHDVEKGGKIIMPPSALDQLTRLNVVYPMLFKLTNNKRSRHTHAGVLEFVADEGKVYLPYWMMRNLFLDEGDILQVESVCLPVATFSKFQPQNSDFLDITNQKAVLENALRNFACLTTGDLVAIKYNQRVYELCVLETKPADAVSIIECDMNVEFEAPIGYKEPSKQPKVEELPNEAHTAPIIQPPSKFSGQGVRLDGKKKRENKEEIPVETIAHTRGIPDYDHLFGFIKFDRSVKPINDRTQKPTVEEEDPGNTFHGQGFSLKKERK